MTTLKNIGYTLLILACIGVVFVAIPIIGFFAGIALAVVCAVLFVYFVYVGVKTLREMQQEAEQSSDRNNGG